MLKESDLKKLADAKVRHAELEHLLAEAGTGADQDTYQKLAKEFADLAPLVELHHAYHKALAGTAEARHMLQTESDKELRQMAQHELEDLERSRAALEARIHDLFDPFKHEKDLDVIIEIRAGTGGVEASIFAGDLYRMYTKYAAVKGWKIDPMAISESEKGFKEVVFGVSGKGASRRLKWESGTHRVQRVPETEASGRIHTSAATVAVLFEPEEVDLAIDPKDLKIDVYRSSGPGGQSVNTADSAIRVTHLPTGMVVVCQDERSQLKNRMKAMRVLRARLQDHIQHEREKKEAASRKAQVGTGDRSEKIRTYNFPDHRVTDHRIGFTVHQLPAVMEGDLDALFDALLKAEEDARDKAK